MPLNYVYLLGLYLGDGSISTGRKHVFRLRITLDQRYPAIIAECRAAMEAALPNRVYELQREGCVEVSSYSKHWVCLFPQHGTGMKHTRLIALTGWQTALVDEFPGALLRGLIHSDGCRVTNRVWRPVAGERRQYAYTRYFLSNVSTDIQGIFTDACDRLGIEWRRNRWNSISIARKASVALLDDLVGPKS